MAWAPLVAEVVIDEGAHVCVSDLLLFLNQLGVFHLLTLLLLDCTRSKCVLRLGSTGIARTLTGKQVAS